ncbi:hypothetical protein Bca4012_084542 [Brassica carinata]
MMMTTVGFAQSNYFFSFRSQSIEKTKSSRAKWVTSSSPPSHLRATPSSSSSTEEFHKDDAKLISGTMKYRRNWARVSTSIFHHEKSPMACKERHLEITEPKWTTQEDLRLTELVQRFGRDVMWTTVASLMECPFKSCESRYAYLKMNGMTTVMKSADRREKTTKRHKPARKTQFETRKKKRIEL